MIVSISTMNKNTPYFSHFKDRNNAAFAYIALKPCTLQYQHWTEQKILLISSQRSSGQQYQSCQVNSCRTWNKVVTCDLLIFTSENNRNHVHSAILSVRKNVPCSFGDFLLPSFFFSALCKLRSSRKRKTQLRKLLCQNGMQVCL